MDKRIILILLVIYAIYNIVTFIVYGIDKKKAQKGTWRISEKTLLSMAFFGGAFGGVFGMQIFRHKTKHIQFKVIVPLSLVIQICLWAILIIKFV